MRLWGIYEAASLVRGHRLGEAGGPPPKIFPGEAGRADPPGVVSKRPRKAKAENQHRQTMADSPTARANCSAAVDAVY